jgi:hypothetical protein
LCRLLSKPARLYEAAAPGAAWCARQSVLALRALGKRFYFEDRRACYGLHDPGIDEKHGQGCRERGGADGYPEKHASLLVTGAIAKERMDDYRHAAAFAERQSSASLNDSNAA